jgi:hypothetical protein
MTLGGAIRYVSAWAVGLLSGVWVAGAAGNWSGQIHGDMVAATFDCLLGIALVLLFGPAVAVAADCLTQEQTQRPNERKVSL